MRKGYLRACRVLDRITLGLASVAGVVMVALVLGNVLFRYGFGVGSIKAQDAAAYAFAMFLILSLPLALTRGAHVRVDVLSTRLGPRYLRRADALAWAFAVVPVFGLILISGWRDVAFSWQIAEGSVTPGGLGGLYLIRAMLPVAAALTILQGLAVLLRARDAA